MPFPMKVQPINSEAFNDASSKPASRSRLKRLFDRPFTTVLRSATPSEKLGGPAGEFPFGKDGIEFEPSSVALDKMVRNFMEDNEKMPAMTPATKYGRNRCNCFNRNSNDSSDDEFDFDFGLNDSKSSFSDSLDTLKSLIPCSSKAERNLLADTSKIVEKNKACKRKDDLVKIVTESLLALNYDAAVCKSKWEKSSSVPAGEYEYIDVVIDHERILIEVDFRSEFEIARSTASYKVVLQSLPAIFVGKSDRLTQIIGLAAEAVKQSLKKKGMHIAPWRKVEYIRSKWLGNFERICPPNDVVKEEKEEEKEVAIECGTENEGGELDLIFGDETTSIEVNSMSRSDNSNSVAPSEEASDEGEKLDFSVKVPWQPPEVKLNNNKAIVTGLASLLKEKF